MTSDGLVLKGGGICKVDVIDMLVGEAIYTGDMMALSCLVQHSLLGRFGVVLRDLKKTTWLL